MNISTYTAARFHNVRAEVSAKDGEVSGLPVHVLEVDGFSWTHNQVPKPEDDENNIRIVAEVDVKKRRNATALCHQYGLYNSYSETYAQPDVIPKNCLFVSALVQLRATTGEIAVTDIAGCIRRCDISEAFDLESETNESDLWISLLPSLLPGSRMESIRSKLSKWWRKVEGVSRDIHKQPLVTEARNKFFMCSRKQSDAYQAAVDRGITTSEGQKLIQSMEDWRIRSQDAAREMSGAVLDTVFKKGEKLLASIIDKSRNISKERLEATKQNLRDKFEADIFALASDLDTQERQAWKNFHDRFKLGTSCSSPGIPIAPSSAPSKCSTNNVTRFAFDVDSSGGTSGQTPVRRHSVTPLDQRDTPSPSVSTNAVFSLSTNLSNSATRQRLGLRLALRKAQRNLQLNNAFLNRTKYEFEFVMFDLAVTEKMIQYMEKEYAALEKKIKSQHSAAMQELVRNHSIEKARAVTDELSTTEFNLLQENHNLEKSKLEEKLQVIATEKRSRFKNSREKTMAKLSDKLDAIRRKSHTAMLSPTAINQFQAICNIYKLLRV
eukprot:CAMPEP_0185039294 /NCGR_PEP_ID=MMETSP1103-20130426/36006_1 /TAXON_ID=36769 /ORGANISM="Paraphysomonas bandaiensis, Strain Caron Lab Isolate" /LENGTH=550 /DNA_ID=CAMNT_0027578125 /DNA_START=155 /DNA_END=1807 /DNA_ORIENTATION=-